MSSFWLRLLMAMCVVGTAEHSLGQFAPTSPANRPGPAAPISSKFLTIPGHAPLSMESVQREIGLSPEQRQQLKAVSDAYVASMQQLGKTFQELSPEERQKRSSDFRNQSMLGARKAQRKAEAVLSPHQLQVLNKIAFQLSAAAALSDPGLQDKLGLSPEQRERLNAVYEQAGEKMQKLQRDTAAQVMQLLEEEQTAELKKLLEPRPKAP